MAKPFLLGHGKYGPQPGWKPAHELKGLPETTSNEVKRLIESAYHEVGDATWLTLSELESIDLGKPLGLPDDIAHVLRSPTRYFRFTVRTDDEYEYVSESKLDESVIRSAVEGKTRIEHDGRTIHAEQFSRENYAIGFKKMVKFMQDLADGSQYETYSISPERLRLLVWADGERSTSQNEDRSGSLLRSFYRLIRAE